MAREQKRIEQELLDFERNIFGDQAKKDSLDSIAKTQTEVKTKKEKKVNRRAKDGNDDKEEKVTKTRRSTRPSATSPARVSVRRERH